MISVEVTETEPKDNEAVSWRCVAYGDIYELVPVTEPGDDRPPMAQFAGKSSEEPIVRQHLAPKGFKYRRINDQDTEVTSDVVGTSPSPPSSQGGHEAKNDMVFGR